MTDTMTENFNTYPEDNQKIQLIDPDTDPEDTVEAANNSWENGWITCGILVFRIIVIFVFVLYLYSIFS